MARMHIISVVATTGVSSQKGYDAEVIIREGAGEKPEPDTFHKVIAEGFETASEAEMKASEECDKVRNRMCAAAHEVLGNYRDA